MLFKKILAVWGFDALLCTFHERVLDLANLYLRNLDEGTKKILSKKAADSGLSLDKYVCSFLENAFVSEETLNREERFVTSIRHLSDTLNAFSAQLTKQQKQIDLLLSLFLEEE